MNNLLFFGTTNYGINLSESDKLKFKELSTKFNISVITYGEKEEFIKHDDVAIKYFKKPKKLLFQYIYFYLFNYKFVKNFCKDNKVGIISCKDPIAAFIPVLIKKFSKYEIKLIIEQHGDYLNLLLNQRKFRSNLLIKILSKIISNFTYKNCDLIRGVEHTYTNSVAKKYNKKFITFPAWVDYSIFTTRDFERKNLLFVGNIIPRKGVLFLIRQFHEFCKNSNYKEKLLIVGDEQNPSYAMECKKYISDNDIKNVEFLGRKDSFELAKLYSSSKLLLMASNFEGLPRVLIESGLCGIPSLATDIQGINEPFGSKGGTLLYELNNHNEFKNKLKMFLQEDNIQKDLGKKALNLSVKLAGKNSFVENWEEAISILYE